MDYEFLLIDRIDAIRKVLKRHGEENFVLSFSGGKDSVVLHFLLDIAIPGNTIPRVFINTGIEYKNICKYVNDLALIDDRIEIIKPEYPLGKVFKKYGYPFKSKEHSQLVHLYQQNGFSNSVERYYNPPDNRKRFGCPKILKYQFEGKASLKISKECCDKLKKKTFEQYQVQKNKPYKLTGERISEGGLRASHGDCLVINKQGVLKKFKPLNPMTDEWMNWFVETHDILLCDLYYEPYNLKRTGCVGCPFNRYIANDLEMSFRLLPEEYRRAKTLWKPVYDEYIRIGYRLKKYPDEL